jgi:hypothetical protein
MVAICVDGSSLATPRALISMQPFLCDQCASLAKARVVNAASDRPTRGDHQTQPLRNIHHQRRVRGLVEPPVGARVHDQPVVALPADPVRPELDLIDIGDVEWLLWRLDNDRAGLVRGDGLNPRCGLIDPPRTTARRPFSLVIFDG